MTRAQAARVAVVVPIHNGASFLGKALDSLLSQTYQKWEAVLVDDASADGSGAIASAYEQRHPDRFTLIQLDRSVGVAAARNHAIAFADMAELVALLDHDDWLRADFLERMVEIYDAECGKGRRIGIVGCDALIHAANGFEDQTYGELMGWYDEVGLDTLIHTNTIFGRALFSRRAFVDVGGFSARCPGSDDWDLWLRIVESGYEVAVTREPLAFYRVHPGAMSRDLVERSDAKLAAYRRLLARGMLSARQRRLARRRIRHFRAVRAKARFDIARARSRSFEALRLALLAAPQGFVAMLEDPAHWTRYARAAVSQKDLLRR